VKESACGVRQGGVINPLLANLFLHYAMDKWLAGPLSSKLRAQNSKKNNYNQEEIDRHLEYIENKLAEYQKELAENDGDKEETKKEITKQQKRKEGYKELEDKPKDSGQPQIPTHKPIPIALGSKRVKFFPSHRLKRILFL
jgi:retron-type reverse transcriptase